jgi:hypothetical protein
MSDTRAVRHLKEDKPPASFWIFGVIGCVLCLLALSIRTEDTLRPEPPAEFVSVSSTAGGAPNPELAAAYWYQVVQVIQWKYTRSVALSEAVPREFRPLGGDLVPGDSIAARQAYWNELRRLWGRSDLWLTRYRVDAEWAVRFSRDVYDGVVGFVRASLT